MAKELATKELAPGQALLDHNAAFFAALRGSLKGCL